MAVNDVLLLFIMAFVIGIAAGLTAWVVRGMRTDIDYLKHEIRVLRTLVEDYMIGKK